MSILYYNCSNIGYINMANKRNLFFGIRLNEKELSYIDELMQTSSARSKAALVMQALHHFGDSLDASKKEVS